MFSKKSENNPNLTASERYEICLNCDRFLALTKQCKECGCFLRLKTKVKSQSCPLGKW